MKDWAEGHAGCITPPSPHPSSLTTPSSLPLLTPILHHSTPPLPLLLRALLTPNPPSPPLFLTPPSPPPQGPARPPKSKRKTTAATSTLTTPTAASQGSSPSNSPNLQKKTEVKKEDNMDLLLDLNFTGGGSVQENTTNGSAPLAPLLQESPAALGQGGQEATDSLFAGLHNASSGQTVDPIPSASLLSGLTGSLERPTVGLSATNVLEGLTPGIKLPAELEACPHTPFTVSCVFPSS